MTTRAPLAPGRYCLATCYCGTCPHYQPYRLTGRQTSALFAYLRIGRGGRPYTPSWWRDPQGGAPVSPNQGRNTECPET